MRYLNSNRTVDNDVLQKNLPYDNTRTNDYNLSSKTNSFVNRFISLITK